MGSEQSSAVNNSDNAAALPQPIQNTQHGSMLRVALVIGNSAYDGESIPRLKNPVNDAVAIGSVLKHRLGFQVTILSDAMARQDMEEAVDVYCDKLCSLSREQDVIGFFFYAGHAVAVQGENYFIPTRARVRKRVDLKCHAMPMEFLLERLELAGNGLNILVLDCCREDPFGRLGAETQSIGGIVAVRDVKGLLLAYSCAPGTYARDSEHQANSVYTTHLLRHLVAPNKTVLSMFVDVRRAVTADTNNEQVPWESHCLTHNIKLMHVEASPTLETSQTCRGTQGTFEDRVPQDCWGMLESLCPEFTNVFFDSSVGDVVSLGRDCACTISVPKSVCISRRHCEIFTDDENRVVLRDVSSNGTWVNGTKVGKDRIVVLHNGDEIVVQKPRRAKRGTTGAGNARILTKRIAFKFVAPSNEVAPLLYSATVDEEVEEHVLQVQMQAKAAKVEREQGKKTETRCPEEVVVAQGRVRTMQDHDEDARFSGNIRKVRELETNQPKRQRRSG